jgi:hypothetical protein
MASVYTEGPYRDTGERNCERCETTYLPRRKSQRFCKPNCRVNAHHAKVRRPNTVREQVLNRDGHRCQNPHCNGDSPRLFARQVRPGKRTPENCLTFCGRCCALVSHEEFLRRTSMSLARYWNQCKREKEANAIYYKALRKERRDNEIDDYSGKRLYAD